ncbi:hypothetical protein [Paracidovorax cattleyae]|uniref:hypothetical protein n=1 Tax=Paracidovorax cattleyae TaxID=80868 RepID=UPI0018AF6F49|nr:hypothetical protein [Paracidovorax cattleyae]MBF9263376.1 hypothetical protein [Paracidovorax cattleyae]
MTGFYRQIQAIKEKLLPKLINRGSGGVQVGKVSGDVTATSFVTIVNVQAESSASRREESGSSSLTTPEQREVLRMIRQLPVADSVFTFMKREFGTHMVIDLQPSQLLRVRRYIEAINRRQKKPGCVQ